MAVRGISRGAKVSLGWLAIGIGLLFPACSRGPVTPSSSSSSTAGTPANASAGPAPSQNPLKAKFSVLVRGPVRTQEPVPVEDENSLPVQDRGAMVLEAQLDEPAYIYLVWIDWQGRVSPLYPWNNESLEVTDIDRPPPVRRATNRVFSPMLGRDWTFAEGRGLETVILLVRRSPLPSVKLSELLSGLQQQTAWNPHELVMLSLDVNQGAIESFLPAKRVAAAPAATQDELLAAWMRQLGAHFELVQVVRFAHGKSDSHP